MSQRSRKYLEVEAGLGSDLAAYVAQRRGAGLPWRKVADAVTAASGVDVTSEALRQWFTGRDPVELPEAATA